VHFATWFHENIESLYSRQLDDWGYALRPIRGQTTGYSNHASGTAIDLNATSHPLGARNTFNERQERMLRERLAGHYGGTIRWGGSYSGRADEMHFEIDRPFATVVAAANRLRPSAIGRRVALAND
jgi:hypothetical protein